MELSNSQIDFITNIVGYLFESLTYWPDNLVYDPACFEECGKVLEDFFSPQSIALTKQVFGEDFLKVEIQHYLSTNKNWFGLDTDGGLKPGVVTFYPRVKQLPEAPPTAYDALIKETFLYNRGSSFFGRVEKVLSSRYLPDCVKGPNPACPLSENQFLFLCLLFSQCHPSRVKSLSVNTLLTELLTFIPSLKGKLKPSPGLIISAVSLVTRKSSRALIPKFSKRNYQPLIEGITSGMTIGSGLRLCLGNPSAYSPDNRYLQLFTRNNFRNSFPKALPPTLEEYILGLLMHMDHMIEECADLKTRIQDWWAVEDLPKLASFFSAPKLQPTTTDPS